MTQNNNRYYFLLLSVLFASALFFSNSIFLPHLGLLLLIPVSLAMTRFKLNYLIEDSVLFLFVAGAYFNLLFNYHNIVEFRDYSSFGIGIILLTLFISRNINKTVILCFIAFSVGEGLLIWYESLSILFQSFFIDGSRLSESLSQLYLKRPPGISDHSVLPGMKFLICILLLKKISASISSKLFFILSIFFSISLVLNFSRTALVSLVVYLILLVLVRNVKIRPILARTVLLSSVVVFILISVIFSDYLEHISSGRSYLVALGVENFLDNFITGNGSISWYSYFYSIEGDTTHNSFLHLFIKHGLIGCFFLFYVLKKVNSSNFIFIYTIFFYSFFNRGIFWNISLMDIFMFFFLEFSSKDLNDSNTELGDFD